MINRKRRAVEAAEAAGEISDSMEVRKELLRQVKTGELSVTEMQAALKRVKREGRKKGLKTRSEVYNRS